METRKALPCPGAGLVSLLGPSLMGCHLDEGEGCSELDTEMSRKMVTFKSTCVCEHVPADRVGDAKGGLRNKERKPWRSSSHSARPSRCLAEG